MHIVLIFNCQVINFDLGFKKNIGFSENIMYKRAENFKPNLHFIHLLVIHKDSYSILRIYTINISSICKNIICLIDIRIDSPEKSSKKKRKIIQALDKLLQIIFTKKRYSTFLYLNCSK